MRWFDESADVEAHEGADGLGGVRVDGALWGVVGAQQKGCGRGAQHDTDIRSSECRYTSPHVAVGQLIRRRRGLARRSGMELAHSAGISPRQLSFVDRGWKLGTLKIPMLSEGVVTVAARHEVSELRPAGIAA
ncbi:hypothetical protein C5E45_25670 [Nocardia nova]|uniref:Uncharacterized protein n=1 Tax=Nocardia nova TaxID=37330 RepID=A0A2S6AJS1_9NOCA|nr:hypothetical protein [Nocardia nova]PPJ25478.1 hypothetical protein C5E41_19720 [Nocardia nova]PPJ35457.1 hypothetical protein C5E45_25670 [Nocardia nova]